MARDLEVFSEKEFEQWLVGYLESEREWFREHAAPDRNPRHPAGFYESARNREKETQDEDER
jgi:hypothetical protein